MHQISKNELSEIFQNLKLKKGSSCLLHSSIMHIGKIEGIKIDDTPKAIIQLILKEIGPNGTISALTPYYDYTTSKKIFDVSSKNCSKEFGSTNSYLASICNSRSIDPIFNISSLGKMSSYINKNASPSSFGSDSTWDRLYKINTNMVFLGCDMRSCTFVRFIESKFCATYLYNKFFNTPIKKNKKIITNNFSSFLRYRQIKIKYDLLKFQKHLLKKKILIISNNKKFKAMSIEMQPCFKEGIAKLKKNSFYFLKKNPFKKFKNISPQD